MDPNDVTILIDSKDYSHQDANEFTVQLDREFRNVSALRITYAGIPCTFYNISRKLGNNYFAVSDGVSAYKYLTLPDGFYDIESFSRAFQKGYENLNFGRYGISFDVQESTGKMLINFRKRSGRTPSLAVTDNNAELLGFNVSKGSRITLPRTVGGKTENPALSDKPINFKPFEYFLVHCDIIDDSSVLYNGKRSSVLARFPVKKCDFGEITTYNLSGSRGRRCDQSFNKIRLWITDEDNNPIDFNGANIQYELLLQFSTK